MRREGDSDGCEGGVSVPAESSVCQWHCGHLACLLVTCVVVWARLLSASPVVIVPCYPVFTFQELRYKTGWAVPLAWQLQLHFKVARFFFFFFLDSS